MGQALAAIWKMQQDLAGRLIRQYMTGLLLITAKDRELIGWKAFTEICLHLLARNWLQGAVKSWVRIRSV